MKTTTKKIEVKTLNRLVVIGTSAGGLEAIHSAASLLQKIKMEKRGHTIN